MKKIRPITAILAGVFLLLTVYRFATLPPYQREIGAEIYAIATASAPLSSLALILPIYFLSKRKSWAWYGIGTLCGLANQCATVMACNVRIIYIIEGKIPHFDTVSIVLISLCGIALGLQICMLAASFFKKGKEQQK